jgi:hypothetical protein
MGVFMVSRFLICCAPRSARARGLGRDITTIKRKASYRSDPHLDRVALVKQRGFKVRVMSALPPKVDMVQHNRGVRFVPKADILRRSDNLAYSMTASAIAKRELGIVRLSTGE